MQKVILTFKYQYPIAGMVRKAGTILIEGKTAIKGITADKILNAMRNGVIKVDLQDEKNVDSDGVGSMPGKRFGRNNESANQKHERKR